MRPEIDKVNPLVAFLFHRSKCTGEKSQMLLVMELCHQFESTIWEKIISLGLPEGPLYPEWKKK